MSQSKTSTGKAQRTTAVVAVSTFVVLSLITITAWSVTRKPDAPQPAAVPVAEAPMAAEQHDHDHDFERISIDDLRKAHETGGFVVIDVRPMDAYLASHIPGSLHIPLTRVEGEIPYLPKGKTVVTYCSCPAEESSGQAAMILANAGVAAKALHGGFDAWVAAGYPVESQVPQAGQVQ